MSKRLFCLISFILLLALVGSAGAFTGDCSVDYNDLREMVDDWLLADGTSIGLQAHWAFDGDACDSADSYDGTFVSDANIYTSDPCRASVLILDGNDDYVVTAVDVPVGQVFSVTAWVKADGNQGSWDCIVTNNYADSFWLGITTDSSFGFTVNYDSDTLRHIGTIDANAWQHLAGTFDGTNGSLYVDGVLIGGPSAMSNGAPNDFDGPVYIGIRHDASTVSSWHGLIDDVRLYDVALSESDVNDLYHGIEPSPALLYVPLLSPANLSPKVGDEGVYNPNNRDMVNFKDLAVLLGSWWASEACELHVALLKLLSEDGSTGAMKYLMSNKIVTLDGKTHVTWMDLVSGTQRVMISTYNHASQTWTQPVQVGTAVDDHGGPALTSDSNGYLHIIFGPHGGDPFHYYRSTLPNDSNQWEDQNDFGVDATYPSMVCDDNDTLHVVYRRSQSSPWELLYQRLPAGGSWSTPQALAVSPDTGYSNYDKHLLIGPDNTIHMGYHLFKLVSSVRVYKVGHMMSADRGDTWTLADGTSLTLPVTYDANAFFAPVGMRKIVGMAIDSQSHPWINTEVESTRKARIYHYDGVQWNWLVADDRMPPGIALQDGYTHYLTRPLGFDSQDGLYMMAMTVDDEVVAYSDDQGQSFSVLELHPRNGNTNKIHHSIERRTGHHSVDIPWLMFAPEENGAEVNAVKLGF